MNETLTHEAVGTLDQMGVRGMTESEMKLMSAVLAQDLRGAVADPPVHGSLLMIDTHLGSVSASDLQSHAGETACVLEFGGTNSFGAQTRINEAGIPEFVRGDGGVEISARGPLSQRHFESPDAYFADALRPIEAAIRQAPIKNLAIIYSFPASIIDTEFGVDAVSPDELPKGFIIRGMNDRPVGEALVAYMRKAGYDMNGLKSLVVLNDTPAAMAFHKIGGIVGTGYNLAFVHENRKYNTEIGGFPYVLHNALTREVDARSEKPGKQLSEKQISGLYLGETLEVAIEELNQRGSLHVSKVNPDKSLSGEVLTHILTNNRVGVAEYLGDATDEKSMAILTVIADRLRLRSAQLVGTHLATIVNTFPQEHPGVFVKVPIEGSVFWGIPQYRQIVGIYAGLLSGGKVFEFPYLPHPGAMGATAAVVGLRR